MNQQIAPRVLYLRRLSGWLKRGEIRLSESAGLLQMSFVGSPGQLSTDILDGYYTLQKN
jgi:hypothetical protein